MQAASKSSQGELRKEEEEGDGTGEEERGGEEEERGREMRASTERDRRPCCYHMRCAMRCD